MDGTDVSQDEGIRLEPEVTCWAIFYVECTVSLCVCSLCVKLLQFNVAVQRHADLGEMTA